jgi:hypothetical protein
MPPLVVVEAVELLPQVEMGQQLLAMVAMVFPIPSLAHP